MLDFNNRKDENILIQKLTQWKTLHLKSDTMQNF